MNLNLKILVDADACPVKSEIINIGLKFNLQIIFVTNINYNLRETMKNHSSQAIKNGKIEFLIVDNRADSVDFAIVNRVKKNDIVVTQDYGLSAMVLSKNGFAISPTGKIFNNQNITAYLEKRHLARKERKKGIRTRGPKAFSKEDRLRFEKQFETLVRKILSP